MGMVADALRVLDPGSNDWREATGYGDDFETAWNTSPNGSFLAYLTRRVGLSWERVSSVALDALDAQMLRIDAAKFTGGFKTPEAAFCLAVFLKRCIDGRGDCCGDETDRAVADAYRGSFSFAEVAEAMRQSLVFGDLRCESVCDGFLLRRDGVVIVFVSADASYCSCGRGACEHVSMVAELLGAQ